MAKATPASEGDSPARAVGKGAEGKGGGGRGQGNGRGGRYTRKVPTEPVPSSPPPVVVAGPSFSTRRVLAWGTGLGLPLALLLALVSVDQGLDCCMDCGTYRRVGDWGLGIGSDQRPLVVIVPNSPERPSRALADLFPADHEHDWRQSDHRLNGVPGLLASQVCGGRYRNAFGNAYEEHDGLREFVLGEIRAGRATLRDVRGMLRLDRSRPWMDTPEEAALRARAWAWMKSHAPGAPDFHMDGSRFGAQAEGVSSPR